jgi:hypothetical protein
LPEVDTAVRGKIVLQAVGKPVEHIRALLREMKNVGKRRLVPGIRRRGLNEAPWKGKTVGL